MVKYLGLDYLKLAVNQKHEFLNRALIAVPEHLEVIDIYPHKGSFKDDRYRYPWKRASCDSKFLQDERDKSFSLDILVPKVNTEQNVENFECDTDEELGNFDLYDFVPSSDPDDVSDNINFPAKTRNSSTNETSSCLVEIHQKENLQNDFRKEIEEPLTEELFDSAKKNLPSLKCLLDRLHQNQIKDPFSTTNTSNFDLTLRYPSSDIYENNSVPKVFMEDFTKDTVDDDDNILLEEIISPFTETVAVREKSKICELFKGLKEISDQEYGNEEIPLPKYSTDVKQHQEVLIEKNDSIRNEDIFLKINEIGREDDKLESKALLETPVVTNSFKLESASLQISSLLQTLPRYQVNDINLTRFFTTAEVNRIELKAWQKEKYFCDILSMRITEPDVDAFLMNHDSLHAVLQQQKLMKEDQIVDVELSLNWDPFGNRIESIRQNFISPEKIDMIVEKATNPEVFKVKVEKYQTLEVFGWEDEYLDLTESQAIATVQDLKESHTDMHGFRGNSFVPDIAVRDLSSKETISTEEDFGFDQIDDFFTLRTGVRPQFKSNIVAFEHIQKDDNIEYHAKPRQLETDKMYSEIVMVTLGGIDTS